MDLHRDCAVEYSGGGGVEGSSDGAVDSRVEGSSGGGSVN